MADWICLLRKAVAHYGASIDLSVGKVSRFWRTGAACFLVFTLTLVVSLAARADEPLFGYSYTTDLLPKRKFEIEQWSTTRFTKAQGNFWLQVNRTELSYGVRDNFQLSLYANYVSTYANANAVDGTTTPPETFAGPLFDPGKPFRDSKFMGVSLEGIYRIFSPYTRGIGLAVYFEPTLGHQLREYESKVILQKNFFDDRFVWAFNTTVVQETRFLQGDPNADPLSDEFLSHWDHETDMNFSTGATYRFAGSWWLGGEFMNEREFSRFAFWKSGAAMNSAFYVGPAIHYGGRHFFGTLTFLEQLPWASDYTDPKSNVLLGGRTYADDFEKYRVRIKVGWYF
jgi:hypothetical protein